MTPPEPLEIRPVVKIKVRDTVYVYSYRSQWDPIHKRGCQKDRKIVGRLVNDDFVIFGKTFLALHPEFSGCHGKYSKGIVVGVNGEPVPNHLNTTEKEEVVKKAILSCSTQDGGGSYILDWIATRTGIKRDLIEIFGESLGTAILSLAMYFVLFENDAVCRYSNKAINTWFPSGPLSSQRISEIFQDISYDNVCLYFQRRIKSRKRDEDFYWAYDTTSISSYSKLAQIAYGVNKENDKLPQLNLAMLTDDKSNEPLFFQVLQGSISDAKAFRDFLSKMTLLDPENIRLVLDRAFSAPSQLNSLYAINLGFISGSKLQYSFTRSTFSWARNILMKKELERFDPETRVFCCTRTINWSYDDPVSGVLLTKPLHIHAYYSVIKEGDKIDAAASALSSLKDKGWEALSSDQQEFVKKVVTKTNGEYVQDSKKWEKWVEEAGFFFLVSNVEKDARRALNLYKERDVIEKGFTNFKERCGGRRLRCQEEALEGKVFTLFIGVALRMVLGKLYRSLEPNLRRHNSLEEFLQTAQTTRRNTTQIDGKPLLFWDSFPKSVEDAMKGMGINIPR